VGRGNRYGHPAPETLERLGLKHAAVWRTDLDGTITVVTDGQRMEVRTRRRKASFDLTSTAP
jgi:competence protein ComEC